MSESRQELLAWVNQLCQTNYTKIEHLGTGGAYCQILDSIYYDVPLSRVKFSAKNDYEYANNLKILQNMFKKHKIDKPILADRLMKLKFQDNFEFLQWLKRYWDAYNPNTPYDAVGRRRGQHVEGPVVRPGSSASSVGGRTGSRSGYHRPPVGGARNVVGSPVSAVVGRGGTAGGRGVSAMSRPGGIPGSSGRGTPGGAAAAAANSALVQDLTAQLNDAKVLLDTAEKERDFYFSKLREIEIMTQQIETEEGSQIDELIKQIQEVLYNTEESVVHEEDGDVGGLADGQPSQSREFDSVASAHHSPQHHLQQQHLVQQTQNLNVDNSETF
ncbi:microtubule integrity protein mal3 [Mycoemilia scoparia]|uniref:Microtubule integrity protein mal3 n=1 Tax=Mycoemilia scoparia TaxID=417184 RepID=A0A9W7ZQG1_9FUNG|nr:microtubule integrity protein mal3 [Mycoemilia scoparia]